MSANFKVQCSDRNGDLHVRASGVFDGSSACALSRLLEEKYTGQGEIVIDTRHLQKVIPFGCRMFQNRMQMSRIPACRLCFCGEKGVALALKGSRVTEVKPCGCSGNCARCACKGAVTDIC